MRSVICLLSASLLCETALAQAGRPLGADPERIPEYQGMEFRCFDGTSTIPTKKVNDDYCDCRDGSDEPGTSACNNGRFYCYNKGFKPMTILSSFVGDGVCDCCDGTDEPPGVCTNTCMEDGKEFRQKFEQGFAAMEAGIAKRAELLAEAARVRQEHEQRRQELIAEQEGHQPELEEKRALKAQEEALEAKEREDLATELAAAREAREAEAAAAAEAQSTDETTTDVTTEAAGTEEAAAPADEAAVEEEKAAFPYPSEYAAPKTDEPAEEEAAAFPYPAEYAAPPGEAANEEAAAGDADAAPAEPAEPEVEEPKPEDHKRPEAEEARKAFKVVEDKISAVQRKISEEDRFLGLNFGDEHIFAAIYDKCIKVSHSSYEYEICIHNKAIQHDNGKQTSLGKFKQFEDASDEELENGFWHKKLSFTDGQKCWNGPKRSMTVKLRCSDTEELTNIDEPSTCVYTAVLATPVVCSEEHLQALQMEYESIFGSE